MTKSLPETTSSAPSELTKPIDLEQRGERALQGQERCERTKAGQAARGLSGHGLWSGSGREVCSARGSVSGKGHRAEVGDGPRFRTSVGMGRRLGDVLAFVVVTLGALLGWDDGARGTHVLVALALRGRVALVGQRVLGALLPKGLAALAGERVLGALLVKRSPVPAGERVFLALDDALLERVLNRTRM